MSFHELTIPSTEKKLVEVYKTEKYWIHTSSGKLLDAHMGNTAFIFGFDNSHIKNRMRDLQDKISYVHCKPNEVCRENMELVEKICTLGNYSALAWAVSGSDGVECAIAMNDTYWRNLGVDKQQIISFAPGWHGTTFIERAMRREEFIDKFIVVDAPNWDSEIDRLAQEQVLIDNLNKLLNANQKIGAIIYESIPWLNGILPWSNNFHIQLRALCDKFNINLILDDVMGGVGKLGNYFSHIKFNIQPDITVLGKALTGGFSPLSCACTTDKIAKVIKNSHIYSHTWQPNMAGVGAALGVLDIFNPDSISKVTSRLHYLGEKLIKQGFITNLICDGLIFYADSIEKMNIDVFFNNGITGLGGWELETTKIGIVAPAIADDEYFEELELRLTNSLTKK